MCTNCYKVSQVHNVKVKLKLEFKIELIDVMSKFYQANMPWGWTSLSFKDN